MEEVKEKNDSEVFQCVSNCGKCCYGSVTVDPIDILNWMLSKRNDILDRLKIVFTGPDSRFPRSMDLGFPVPSSKPCIFLDREKKSSIYSFRPLMCRFVPFLVEYGENGEKRVIPNIEACPHVPGKTPPMPAEWYFDADVLSARLTAYSSILYKIFARMLEDRESGEFEAFLSEFTEAPEDDGKFPQ